MLPLLPPIEQPSRELLAGQTGQVHEQLGAIHLH